MIDGGKKRINIVVDTDLFIDNLRGGEKSFEWFNSIRDNSTVDVYFSAMTEAELFSGKECEDREKEGKILALLSIGKKLVVNNEIAKLSGLLRRRYGLYIGDAVIAATALEIEAVLCTRNISDYHMIPNLKLKAPY